MDEVGIILLTLFLFLLILGPLYRPCVLPRRERESLLSPQTDVHDKS